MITQATRLQEPQDLTRNTVIACERRVARRDTAEVRESFDRPLARLNIVSLLPAANYFLLRTGLRVRVRWAV
jgi:hypothetical protein